MSRNTVRKYADMKDMSPAAPVSARPHPAIDADAAWVDSVLEADLGAPRKQRHTAKRIYDRLVEERGYAGSYLLNDKLRTPPNVTLINLPPRTAA